MKQISYFLLLLFFVLFPFNPFFAKTVSYVNYSITATDTQNVITQTGRWGWGQCFSVAIKGNYAFVGNGEVFQIYNISDTLHPKLTGELLTEDMIFKIIVSGNYAYIVSPLRIIDISDPAYPALINTIKIDKYPPNAIAIKGNHLFVADLYGAVYSVDVTDPRRPIVKGYALLSGERATDIKISGNYLYGTSMEGLSIDVIDITDPSNLIRISQNIISAPGFNLYIRDNYLFAGVAVSPKIRIFDISNPYSLKMVGSINIDNDPLSFSFSEEYLFVSHESGISTFDASNPGTLQFISTLNYPYFYNNVPTFGATELNVSFGAAYIASGAGLWIVDVGNIYKMKTANFIPSSSIPARLFTDNNKHLFVSTGIAGLKIVDYSDPNNPTYLSTYMLPNEQIRDVAVFGNKAYIMSDHKMQILNIDNLQKPELFSSLVLSDTINDNNGYLALGNLIVADSIVFITRPQNKLVYINASDPANPKLDGAFTLPGVPISQVIYGKYLFIAIADLGLEVFDISSNVDIKQVKFIPLNEIRGICIGDNKLFAMTGFGFFIYEISDSLNMTQKSSIKMPPGMITADMKYQDKLVFTVYSNTFVIINTSDISNPEIIFLDNNSANIYRSICLDNKIIIVGSDEKGVIFFRNNITTDVQNNRNSQYNYKLSQNFPNPFNSQTTLEFITPIEGNVTIELFNLLGEKIKTIFNGFVSVGTHRINFVGESLPSGIYLYKLRSGNASLIKKMVILK